MRQRLLRFRIRKTAKVTTRTRLLANLPRIPGRKAVLFSNYIKVDKEDEITVDCYPEGCDENNINPYDYWSDLIDFIGCELLEQRMSLFIKI